MEPASGDFSWGNSLFYRQPPSFTIFIISVIIFGHLFSQCPFFYIMHISPFCWPADLGSGLLLSCQCPPLCPLVILVFCLVLFCFLWALWSTDLFWPPISFLFGLLVTSLCHPSWPGSYHQRRASVFYKEFWSLSKKGHTSALLHSFTFLKLANIHFDGVAVGLFFSHIHSVATQITFLLYFCFRSL